MDDHRADDRVFIRSKWGTNRYVYNPHNPAGMTLIVGSLLFAAGGMFWLYHPDLFKGGWDDAGLRSAVSGATAELSQDPAVGPGSGMFEEVVAEKIAEHGDGPADGLTVTAASAPATADLWKGGPENADYTVTARGTETALCLHAFARRAPKAAGYESVSFTVADGACPDSVD
ncbi:hypothetical protein AB0J38_17015 [Streptomyces sp. NPDC050095]|uniref:hypothetical protein n=1 Tax=unclassified Streptomyces TaxID=2593676 RepID=UPI00343C11FA